MTFLLMWALAMVVPLLPVMTALSQFTMETSSPSSACFAATLASLPKMRSFASMIMALPDNPDGLAFRGVLAEVEQRDDLAAGLLNLLPGPAGELVCGDGELVAQRARAEHLAGDDDDVILLRVAADPGQVDDPPPARPLPLSARRAALMTSLWELS